MLTIGRKPLLIFLGLLWGAFLNGGAVVGQGISVSPSRIFFEGQPGETVSQIITFGNSSANEFNFIPAIKDWERDSVGTKIYFPVGHLEQSNGSWLSLSENTVRLNPGETKEVTLTMTIPEQAIAPLLTHSMVFFTQVNEQRASVQTGTIGLNVLLEVGIQVYHNSGALSSGELEFLAFEDMGNVRRGTDSVRRMPIKIKNHGDVNKDAYVRFELTNMETGEEIPLTSVAIAMLPKAEQWINLDLPADLRGRYLAVAILDAGGQYDLKIAEKEVIY